MKRRQRNLIRGAVGKTLDGLGAHVRMPNAGNSGKSNPQVGSAPTLRVELTSDLHPGEYATAQIRNANKWVHVDLVGTPVKVQEEVAEAVELVPGSSIQILDYDRCCFAMRGEWMEVTWRNDLGYFVPVAPYGLTRLGRATADVSPAATGTFEVLKRNDSGSLVVGATVQARTDFGAAANDGVANDEEVLLVYISDRVRTTNQALSTATAGWQIIQISPAEAVEVRGYLFKRYTGAADAGELVAYWDTTGLKLKAFDEQFNTLQYDAGDDEFPTTATLRNGVNLTPFDYNGYHLGGSSTPYGAFGLPIGPSLFGLIPTMMDPSSLWFGIEFFNNSSLPGPHRMTATGGGYKTKLLTCTDAQWTATEMLQCSGADADEQPRWARFEETSIFICPGMDVLVLYGADFLLFNSYQRLNTEIASGHQHEYKYPSATEVTLGILEQYTGGVVSLTAFKDSQGRSVVGSYNEENHYHSLRGMAVIRHDGSNHATYGRMKRLDLAMKVLQPSAASTAATSYVDPTHAFMIVIPVRPSLIADVQRWTYTPYDDEGNFTWYGPDIDPPLAYDGDGTPVPDLGSLFEGMVTYDIDDFATASIDELAGMPIL